MKLSLTSEAEEELTEAALWYEDRREGLGIEFIEEAERAFQRIKENPRLYQIVQSISTFAGPISGAFLIASISSLNQMSLVSSPYTTILGTRVDGSGVTSELVGSGPREATRNGRAHDE
jgi:hypothetical protein